MKTLIPTLFALVSSSLLAACGASSPNPQPETAGSSASPDLSGTFRSACTDTGGGQAITLDFVLTRTDWKLDYVTYGDSTCKAPFLTVHIEGPYALSEKSVAVPGAWNGRFGFSKKTVTPHGDGAVAFLASDNGCRDVSFTKDAPQDILESGCAGLGQRPRGACSADYDLVSLEGDTLRFGDRPKDNDMCTEGKRPTALSALASTRVR